MENQHTYENVRLLYGNNAVYCERTLKNNAHKLIQIRRYEDEAKVKKVRKKSCSPLAAEWPKCANGGSHCSAAAAASNRVYGQSHGFARPFASASAEEDSAAATNWREGEASREEERAFDVQRPICSSYLCGQMAARATFGKNSNMCARILKPFLSNQTEHDMCFQAIHKLPNAGCLVAALGAKVALVSGFTRAMRSRRSCFDPAYPRYEASSTRT